MEKIIEYYIVWPGMIGLLAIFFLKVLAFNLYKKEKLKHDPNFPFEKYQGFINNTFYIMPYPITEKETENKLLILKEFHNKILKLALLYIVFFSLLVVGAAIINWLS
jgi:hypothetical protein